MIVAPTPEIKPPRTESDIYFSARPAFIIRKTSNHTATRRVIAGTTSRASGDPAVIPYKDSDEPTIAAGMASTPTTN